METKVVLDATVAPIKRNRKITLTVQASDLFKADTSTKHKMQKEVDDNTSIENDGGYTLPYKQPKKDFYTDVYKNFEVTWDILLSSPNGADKGYVLKLVNIDQDSSSGNPNLFQKNPLISDDDGKTIHGKVKISDRITPDTYYVHFTITNPEGKTNPVYTLDPKLRGNP